MDFIQGMIRYFFFFQAEDGIRDLYVTGVQTCALPISARRPGKPAGTISIVDPGADDNPTDCRGSRSIPEIFRSVARTARPVANRVSCRSCAAFDGDDTRFRDRGRRRRNARARWNGDFWRKVSKETGIGGSSSPLLDAKTIAALGRLKLTSPAERPIHQARELLFKSTLW